MMFAEGTPVRVRALMPPGHVRTPTYLRGQTGVIERALGPHPNPEALAYRCAARHEPLYRVRFAMADLWGAPGHDLLEAEIYGHWLEPADAA